MTATIHGELSADGSRIVLIAGGPVEEIAHAAKMLGTLTPLIKGSEPKGALILPATWPAVVQLSGTYGDAWKPGPRLHEWIREQAVVRTADVSDSALSIPVPDGLTPRPYQVEGALLIARTGHALIFDEPRTGKTITTILGLAEWAARTTVATPILVLAPNVQVVDAWVKACRLWAPYWTAVAWKGSPARRRTLIGTADVYVTTYATAVQDAKNTNPAKSPLIALDPRAVVADECHLIKNPNAAQPSRAPHLPQRPRLRRPVRHPDHAPPGGPVADAGLLRPGRVAVARAVGEPVLPAGRRRLRREHPRPAPRHRTGVPAHPAR
jgi:hypothetical protein